MLSYQKILSYIFDLNFSYNIVKILFIFNF